MNRLNNDEAVLLTILTPMLNETADKQKIITHVRKMVNNARTQGINQGRNGWQQDHQWSDKDLM